MFTMLHSLIKATPTSFTRLHGPTGIDKRSSSNDRSTREPVVELDLTICNKNKIKTDLTICNKNKACSMSCINFLKTSFSICSVVLNKNKQFVCLSHSI